MVVVFLLLSAEFVVRFNCDSVLNFTKTFKLLFGVFVPRQVQSIIVVDLTCLLAFIIIKFTCLPASVTLKDFSAAFSPYFPTFSQVTDNFCRKSITKVKLMVFQIRDAAELFFESLKYVSGHK